MKGHDDDTIAGDFLNFLRSKDFPCIAAKAAVAQMRVECFIVPSMACPKDDFAILSFLYSFIDRYRKSGNLYQSAAVIFTGPEIHNEDLFEALFWERLQALSTMDSKTYCYDKRVSDDPQSPDFSFSLKEEAFFIIGLHPASARQARQYKYPVMVFNPHAQFEALRENGKYDAMKYAVRKRDEKISGSINPMLSDFGERTEVFQYSGRAYDQSWKCPLNIQHAKTGNTTA